MRDLTIGGRCERHLSVKPCNLCAKEHHAQREYSPADLRRMLTLTAPKHGSQKAFARSLGVSCSYLSDVLNGRREPGLKMLDGLGLERIVTYRAAGTGGQKQ